MKAETQNDDASGEKQRLQINLKLAPGDSEGEENKR